MNENFTAQEIIEIAIEIEKNGREFYQIMADSSKTVPLRNLFNYLSAEEDKHRQKFEEILKSAGGYQISDLYYATEYMGYMKAIADERVFTKDISYIDLVRQLTSPKQAIDIAISFEKDSIIFLHELQDAVDGIDKKIVQKLLNEERDHIRKLSQMRSQVSD